MRRGGWDFASLALLASWREPGLLPWKLGEQSENVYENKGPPWKTPPGKNIRAVRELALRGFQNENGGIGSKVGEEVHLGVLGAGGRSERDLAEDL